MISWRCWTGQINDEDLPGLAWTRSAACCTRISCLGMYLAAVVQWQGTPRVGAEAPRNSSLRGSFSWLQWPPDSVSARCQNKGS